MNLFRFFFPEILIFFFFEFQEEWLPAEVAQGCGGREMTAVSILGPYLGITVFTEDDSTVAEKFFNYPPNEKPTQATIRSLTSQFQSEMELLRVS